MDATIVLAQANYQTKLSLSLVLSGFLLSKDLPVLKNHYQLLQTIQFLSNLYLCPCLLTTPSSPSKGFYCCNRIHCKTCTFTFQPNYSLALKPTYSIPSLPSPTVNSPTWCTNFNALAVFYISEMGEMISKCMNE